MKEKRMKSLTNAKQETRRQQNKKLKNKEKLKERK